MSDDEKTSNLGSNSSDQDVDRPPTNLSNENRVHSRNGVVENRSSASSNQDFSRVASGIAHTVLTANELRHQPPAVVGVNPNISNFTYANYQNPAYQYSQPQQFQQSNQGYAAGPALAPQNHCYPPLVTANYPVPNPSATPQYNPNAMNDIINDMQRQIALLQIQLANAQQSQMQNLVPPPSTFSPSTKFAPDAQNEILEFDPDKGTVTPERFVASVENAKAFYGFDDRNCILQARLKLKGSAKLWNETEPCISSWQEFKIKLFNNFQSASNSVDIHRQLRDRKQHANESLRTYVFTMKAIGIGHVDEISLITYIVQGLSDTALAKHFYTGIPQTTEELLKKSDTYHAFESVRKPKEKSFPVQKGREPTNLIADRGEQYSIKNTFNDKKKSFNFKDKDTCPFCMEGTHRMKDCPKIQCSQCQKKGHLARDCKKEVKAETTKEATTKSTMLVTKNVMEMTVPVKINDTEENVFIDTGSSVNLMSKSKADELRVWYIETDQIELKPINLTGLNGATCQNLGVAKIPVLINDNELLVKFYIVEDKTIPTSIIIGHEMLQQPSVVLKVERGIATILLDSPEQKTSGIGIDDLKINPNITEIQQKEIQQLVEKVSGDPKEPLQIPGFEVNIKLVNNEPVVHRPRRLSRAEQDCVQEIVNDLLEKNIISQSKSNYASPVVLVDKKNGEKRLCVDYRGINKITVKDKHPLPLISELIDSLSSKKYFTILDLKNGFFHVPMSEESKKYTAFITPNGLFQYNVMPFGLTNGPPTFQRYINKIFAPMLQERKILIYMDDLFLPSETIEEGIENLRIALEIVSQYGLQLRLDKCSFLQTEVEYLGFRIQKDEIKPSARKTEAVSKFPEPNNSKQVQRFLGLAGYFRRFIPKYSTIVRPLTRLLKKESKFVFDKDEREAFSKVKELLTNEPVLKIFSPDKETELHTDASSYGYGAVLLQKQEDHRFHPVHYWSMTTTDSESRYTSFELELLAIVRSLEKFRTYLLGKQFKLLTDCNALKLALAKKEIQPKIYRWSVMLEDFDYTLEHRSGASMQHVDALSRTAMCIAATRNTNNENVYLLKATQQRDPELKAMIEILEKGDELSDKKFILRNGILCYQYDNRKVLFVTPRSLRRNVVQAAHDENGHVGIDKTIDLILRTYWFPKSRRYVQKYIKHCLKCLTYNPDSGKKMVQLHSIPKGTLPFVTIHCDHIGPLVKSKFGSRHILVTIDAYSKFVFLTATKTTSARETITALNNIFNIFGPPKSLISDRGTAFTSTDFEQFLKTHSVEHILNATATPRANGQCERYNRTIANVLSKIIDNEEDWAKGLVRVQQILNATKQRSLAASPSQMLLGYNLRIQPDQNFRDMIEEALQAENEVDHLEHRDDTRRKAETQQIITQSNNEKQYELRHRPPARLAVGDYVLAKVPAGPNKKMRSKYQGPYIISKVLDLDRYVVEDIPGLQRTQKFYVGTLPSDRLRLYIPEDDVHSSSSSVTSEDEPEQDTVQTPNEASGLSEGPKL